MDLSDNSETQETYSYDAAGNIMSAPESSFNYLNNRLITFNGQGVSFDADGNMTSALMGDGRTEFEYDFANRLISAGEVDYTYNAENTRIRTWTAAYDTTYTYNTNCALSQLLTKTTNGFETKYVYGLGLIGEEKGDNFKTYHFDYRGSTVALTDISGTVTDTFKYDAYGKLTDRTGTSYVIFRYNGRDGAVSDRNGLVYMRARYYSPEHKRFVNADILHGGITDSTSLNRYAYVNGNPVSFVDPMGLSKDRGQYGSVKYQGNLYQIYVPGLSEEAGNGWKKVGTETVKDFSFDGLAFISGIEFDDFNEIASGENSNPSMSNEQIALACYAGMFYGVMNSAINSSNSIHMLFEFQKKGNERRVIIQARSFQRQNMYQTYADGNSHSAYINNSGSPFAQGVIRANSAKLYEELTGNEASSGDIYDIEITLDEKHKKTNYSSYIWIDSDGTVMEKPILHEKDKVQLGKRKGLFYMGFEPLIDLPIGGSTPVSKDYQELFNKGISIF